ncbi:MAG: thiamine pyrophosphate-binding protein [Actinobacteria bacterium]|nr:thiamine pyrophosphate-binding protein [Actinomycetota bacterium]MBU4240475.1 thiamine pyrophosphate-binding protein [Actinomycetota bacterium]MBU4386298.1 thiamine pyrophosphate-binding protein [Actinomycetota bacterium]MBU4490375.1 thiamine pyrophosphate-binding protein [Actinomycetota bacterium]MCG2794791.1 thiamine pyrophosphate-binding protein [Actinomycetes bacterium]
MASITGGELLAKCLLNEGVTKVFGIPGGQLTTFIDAIVRVGQPEGLEFVMTRHETAAVNMADAWVRVSGDLAVCTGTVGPGASNMIGGMETAMADNVPLLAITPQIHSDRSYPFQGSQQQLDQMTLFSAVTKWNALVNRWDRIPDLVARALREAYSGKPGPVHLDIPVDVLFETHEEDEIRIAPPERTRNTGRVHGDPDLVAKAAEMLAAAERPMIHAGGGVLWSEASGELKELAEYLCCPVTPTVGARGIMSEDDPLCMVPAGGGAIAAGAGADMVLSVGCTFAELDFWGTPPFWGTPDAQKVIQVDIDPRSIALNREVDLAVVGDAKAVLGQLLEALSGITGKVDSREFTANCQAVEQQAADGVAAMSATDAVPIHPLRLVKEVREFFGEDAIMTVDGGNIGLWCAMGTRVYRPRSFLWAGGSGHLGAGLPLALGAKMAAPNRPTYIIHGDGAFLFSVGELETAARLELPIIDIVANDHSFGMIKAAQHAAFEKRYCGVDFTDIRLDKMAEAMGCLGIRVTEPDEIKPALERAVSSGRPAVLDVAIDCAANLEPPTLGLIVAVWLKGCEGIDALGA